MMINDIDLAYLAGFFDGEGSITIHHNGRPSPRGKNPNHTLQVAIGNTDPRVLVFLHENFGGLLTTRKVPKENHRRVMQWTIRSNGAAQLLSAIYPFLRMKREQAEIALAFQKTKTGYRKKRLSPEDVLHRESKRDAIRELNRREHAFPTIN